MRLHTNSIPDVVFQFRFKDPISFEVVDNLSPDPEGRKAHLNHTQRFLIPKNLFSLPVTNPRAVGM